MAKLKMQGLEKYEQQLLKLKDISREAIGQAIYDGAGIVADQVMANIQSLPVDERGYTKEGTLHGVTSLQKAGLAEGFGIAKLQDEGGYAHVKLGFNGYNGVKSKTYPNGQPNSMIARSVNSGSSFRDRIPFVDNAVSAKKSAAEQAMIKKFDSVISKAL